MRILAIAIRQEKEIKIFHWKGKVKMSLFADDMILHIKNQNPHQKLSELINPVQVFVEYKIDTQKSVAFLHTNNKLYEKKQNKKIPFKITSNKVNI